MAEEQQQQTTAGTQQQQQESAIDAKALQAEIERLRSESAEKDNAIRYWHEQAKASRPTTPKEETPAAEEEDLLEIVSKSGTKGLKEVLKKHGFVEASEVDSRIESRARQIAAENELASKYPDLKDNSSEFFKSTAKHYQQLVSDGVPQVAAMKLAAERAELDGYKSGKRLTAAEKEEREARAKAQGGGSSRAKQAEPEAEDDTLDETQMRICDAMGIDPEAYKKRAKEGVRVGGRVK